MQTQAETAEWMGYDTVEAMNADHDALHMLVCEWLEVPSYSLAVAACRALTEEQHRLANYEEDAILHLQRFIQRLRNAGFCVPLPGISKPPETSSGG